MARSKERAPFADWAAVGLPAFAAALAPWQDKLTSAELIEDFYQPSISIAASVVSVLVCFCFWLAFARTRRRTLVRLCLASVALFLLALAGCLWFVAAFGVYWVPEEGWMLVARLAWQLLYVALFASFSSAVATALLLR
jgi:hypothetical protein